MPRPLETGEWIELYNPADLPLDLTGCVITDATGRPRPLPVGAAVAPQGLLVLLTDSADVPRLNLSFSVAVVMRLPGLNDDGDELILVDSTGLELDRMVYSATAARVRGRSWERIDLQRSGMDKSNWGPCANPSGHTAGRTNSLQPASPDSSRSEIRLHIEPNPFSPDGDGRDDVVRISITSPAEVSRVTATVFDLYGRTTRRLASNVPGGVSAPMLSWDGRADDGKLLPIGRYIILLEAVDARSGRVWSGKATVVLSGRL